MNDQNFADYWLEMSAYDFETAEAMLQSGRFLYVGFMAHQSVEKALKAFHWHSIKSEPPYTHDLWRLAKIAGLSGELNEEMSDLLDELQPLNIEARYPGDKDQLMRALTEEYCHHLLKRVKELNEWIKTRF